jgi:hypothetical protein
MRHHSTRRRGQLKPMDVTCTQDLVEIQVGMLAVHSPPSQLSNAAYTSLLSPRRLPTIMRWDSTPQERQFKHMDVTRNPDLVELWIEMVAALPPPSPDGHDTLYLSHLAPAFTDEYAAG